MALKNIFTKLNKDSERIELSSINELKSMLSSNNNEVNNFETFKKEIETIIRLKNVNSKQASASLKKTASILDGFNRKVDELGLNARDVKEYVALSKSFSELNTIISEYNTKYKF